MFVKWALSILYLKNRITESFKNSVILHKYYLHNKIQAVSFYDFAITCFRRFYPVLCSFCVPYAFRKLSR